MARVDYDAGAGLRRFELAMERLDPRAAVIVASHIALEVELMVVLGRTVRRPYYLSELNFAQKVRVLASTWNGEDVDAENIKEALLKFGTLRNKVAHGNVEGIDAALQALREAYQRLYPDVELASSPDDIAGGIIAFFGDAPTPEEVRRIAEGLERIGLA